MLRQLALNHERLGAGVEEFNWKMRYYATAFSGFDGDVDAEVVQVDGGAEHGHCGEDIHDIRELWSEEGLE